MSGSPQNPHAGWNPQSPTWGVVVIHGVGGATPGATLDSFLSALLQRDGGQVYELADLPEIRRLPDIQPTEHPVDAARKSAEAPHAEETLDADRFDMHARRVAVRQPTDPKVQQALCCEVFWADLARTRPSIGDLLLQLFMTLFSLRYISWAAIRYRKLPWGGLRPLWYFTCSLISGPVAAVYASLLFMLIVRWAALKLTRFAEGSLPPFMQLPLFGFVGAGVAAVSAGFLYGRSKSPYRPAGGLRVFLLVAMFGGVAATLLAVSAREVDSDTMFCLWFAEWALALVLLVMASDPRRIWGSVWRWTLVCIIVMATVLVAASRLAWLGHLFGPPVSPPFVNDLRIVLTCGEGLFAVLIACSLVLVLSWAYTRTWALVRRWRVKKQEPTPEVLTTRYECRAAAGAVNGALGAHLIQIGMWSLVMPTLLLWALSLYAAQDQKPFAQFVESIPLSLVSHVALALVMAVLALGIIVWRRARAYWWKGKVPRLIVHEVLIWGLVIVSCLGGAQLVWANFYRDYPLKSWLEFWVPYVPTLVSGLALGAGFACQNVRVIRDALHIVMDVVGHFLQHRLDYRFRADDPHTQRRKERYDPSRCVIEQRIEYRVWRVLEEMFQMAPIQHLTILSHSQGSQIAVASLWYPQALQRLDHHLSLIHDASRRISLVTMGSPFTHLYQHYFPFRYPPLFTVESKGLDPNETGWPASGLAVIVKEWLNLYRSDDYVGTCITGKGDKSFPKNKELDPGGHTGYWAQAEVIAAVSHLLPGA